MSAHRKLPRRLPQIKTFEGKILSELTRPAAGVRELAPAKGGQGGEFAHADRFVIMATCAMARWSPSLQN